MVTLTAKQENARKVLQGHELTFATYMARSAGNIMKERFKLGVETRLKLDRTVVTEADLLINSLLITHVRSEFPTHNILAEEESDMSRKTQLVWVCDPIDGTMAFCRGIPTCVFSLALVNEGTPILGVVYDPFLDRMYHSVLGGGAFVNKQPIKVSDEKKLAGTAVGHCYWNSSEFKILNMWDDLQINGASPVMLGSITYMGAMVASGQFSAEIHPATSAHDTAALKVIVEEAGGKVTDIFGREQKYDRKINGAIISNGHVHDELLAMARRHFGLMEMPAQA